MKFFANLQICFDAIKKYNLLKADNNLQTNIVRPIMTIFDGKRKFLITIHQ